MHQKAKIALIVSDFPKTSETFIVQKFLGLFKNGWDVHIFCHKSEPHEWKNFPQLETLPDIQGRVHSSWPLKPRPIAIFFLPLLLLRNFILNPIRTCRYLVKGLRFFGLDIFRRFYLDAGLILFGPDILHFEFGALTVGKTYLKKLLDCKLIVSFRGYDLNFSGIENPNYYLEVWRTADGIHCLGEDLWTRTQKRGCPSNKAHALIPPAIDAELFNPTRNDYPSNVGIVERPLRLLSVGRLEWKKGYEFALQAVRILKDCDC